MDRTVRILAVASNGGHWMQLLRITKTLEDVFEICYVSTLPDRWQSVKGQRFYVIDDFSRTNVTKAATVFIQAVKIIKREDPDVIITTGAAPGLIMVLIGWLFGKKTIWMDSLANVRRLSLGGRIASLFVSRVYTQWKGLQRKGKIFFAGNVLD